jgi:hypothetical protein
MPRSRDVLVSVLPMQRKTRAHTHPRIDSKVGRSVLSLLKAKSLNTLNYG